MNICLLECLSVKKRPLCVINRVNRVNNLVAWLNLMYDFIKSFSLIPRILLQTLYPIINSRYVSTHRHFLTHILFRINLLDTFLHVSDDFRRRLIRIFNEMSEVPYHSIKLRFNPMRISHKNTGVVKEFRRYLHLKGSRFRRKCVGDLKGLVIH